jgi:hypothetical protein
LRKMAVIFVALACWSSLVWSQGVHERFVGTWELDRIETQTESGAWTLAKTRWGSQPIGILTYDSAGNMAVQIMRRDRTPLSSAGLAEGQSVNSEALALAPVEEKAAAFDGYTAYFGKYSVREVEGVITHQRIRPPYPSREISSSWTTRWSSPCQVGLGWCGTQRTEHGTISLLLLRMSFSSAE